MSKMKSMIMKLADLTVNYDDNVRMREAYALDKLKIDIASVGGLLNPLIAYVDDAGQTHLVAGFRRVAAINEINEGLEAPSNANIKKQITDSKILFHPILEVPVTVHSGLTEQAIELIRCDHMGVKGLNPYEQYISAKRLFQVGLSEEQVAARLNQSRGWAQERKMLARVSAKYPQIEAEFRKKMLDQPNVFPTMANIRALDKIVRDSSEDQANEAVAKVLNGDVEIAVKPKARTVSEIQKQLELHNNPVVKAVLKWCMGDETVKLSDYNVVG